VFVGYWSNSGQKAALARDALVANDPQPTSASIACFSSEAGFSLYQFTHLSRYDASP
jgi:hypothetical protein